LFAYCNNCDFEYAYGQPVVHGVVKRSSKQAGNETHTRALYSGRYDQFKVVINMGNCTVFDQSWWTCPVVESW